MQITVGSTPLTVTALGRWVAPGNVQTHVVTIYGGDGLPMFGGSVTINTSGKTSGQFVYVPLSSNVVLWDSTTYYILSVEAPPGGDIWYSNDTSVTTTADASLGDSVYKNHLSGAISRGGSGPNKPFVPVDFKYTVGVPGGVTRPGSVFGPQYFSTTVLGPAVPTIMTGTVAVNAIIDHGAVSGGEVFTYQWMLDGVAVSPVLTGDYTMPWSFDTVGLGIPDGTHIIYPRILDSSAASVFDRQTGARSIIVANSGFNNGTQTIPIAAWISNRGLSPIPDHVTYNSAAPNPVHTSYAMPYTFIPGSNSPALRDPSQWYAEVLPGPRNGEYYTNPEFVTTPSGGIYVQYFDSLQGSTTEGSYLGVVFENSQDGTRLNTWISPFSNYVEDPAGGGKWWGVEINGRVFRLDNNGTVTTIIGRTRDRTQPTLDPFYGISEAQMDTKITNIGTFPIGVDNLGGANDLCFDPRDSTHNTLYVAAQIDNWIAKINIATQTVTVYAGTPGAANGYSGDGGPATSALFAQPSSICMDATGVMYVCDQQNSAIRKITAGGTISTLCGGTVGPTPPNIATLTGPGISYNVTSITWNSGPNNGAVVMAAPTTIKLGYTLNLSGATNSGSGDPNIRYVVSAFTDSQHFTVIFEPTAGGKPTIGTIGGSPVFSTHTVDTYSSPTSVGFAARRDPNRWDFDGFIKVASSLGLIKAETEKQADLAREFRNLIHPGRSTRLAKVCDRGTALSALAAVELIVRDLS
jgi:hypothetical protein